MIRKAQTADAAEILAIYNDYIKSSIVTFDETPMTINEMVTKIKKITQKFPWLVSIKNEKIVGYAYADAWKPRSSYKHSIECSIYLQKNQTGRGYGSELLKQLLEQLKNFDFHAIIAGIALPNDQSIKLFEKYGFIKIGEFKEVGIKFNQWIDVGYWELILTKGVTH